MESTGTSLLQLPVRMHGIQLGRPIDLLLDLETWHVLGFVVLCGDESLRFLPFAASNVAADEIAVQSALMLLDDVAFYEKRGRSFRSLLGGAVGAHGSLVDIRVERGGDATDLEVAGDDRRSWIPAAGETVLCTRASAA
ncbi:MAG TPA: hypothetical protein VFA56_06265 [Gaiellaceae bacterium]|nr:hypothetical protein [Gaiellaceae bacterium]